MSGFSLCVLQRETVQDHDRPCDIRRVRRRGLRVHKRRRLLVRLCEVVRRQTSTGRQTVPQGNGRPIRIREYTSDHRHDYYYYFMIREKKKRRNFNNIRSRFHRDSMRIRCVN